MTDTPILSYKKPSHNNNSSQKITISTPSTPNLSQPDSPIGFQLPSSFDSPRSSTSNSNSNSTLPHPNTTNTTRKVSSRRRALQEFYHLNENNNNNNNSSSSSSTTTSGIGITTSLEDLDISNPEIIDNLINSYPIEDILKLRNSISSKLSSSNQTKKSIIYDNYYELIRLSNTLADLSTAKLSKKTDSISGFKLLPVDDDEENDDGDNKIKGKNDLTKEEYVDKTLQELSEFLSTEGDKYNGSFKEVLEKLNTTTIASDNASMLTLKEDDEENDHNQFESHEKQDIINHINYILNLPNVKELDELTKQEAIKDIKKIQQDNATNNILTLQLTKIENTLL